jgi:hypothetical protein
VTGTILIRLLAGRAHLAVLNDAKPGVKHAICDGLIVLISLVGGDFDDGALEEILGVGNAELDTYDRITHG